MVGAEPPVFGDGPVGDRQHRHQPRLAALAGDADDAVALVGKIGADEPQRLGNAQAGAVEQRQHGGIARRDPRLFGKLLAGRDDAPGIAGRQRLGQRFRLLWRAQARPRPPHWQDRAVRDSAAASARRRARVRACGRRRRPSGGWPGRRADRPAAAGRHRQGRARRRDGRSGNAGTGACRAHRRRASARASRRSRDSMFSQPSRAACRSGFGRDEELLHGDFVRFGRMLTMQG